MIKIKRGALSGAMAALFLKRQNMPEMVGSALVAEDGCGNGSKIRDAGVCIPLTCSKTYTSP